jgi:hypothetical protein
VDVKSTCSYCMIKAEKRSLTSEAHSACEVWKRCGRDSLEFLPVSITLQTRINWVVVSNASSSVSDHQPLKAGILAAIQFSKIWDESRLKDLCVSKGGLAAKHLFLFLMSYRIASKTSLVNQSLQKGQSRTLSIYANMPTRAAHLARNTNVSTLFFLSKVPCMHAHSKMHPKNELSKVLLSYQAQAPSASRQPAGPRPPSRPSSWGAPLPLRR